MGNRKPHVLVIDDGREYARVVSEQLSEFKLVTPDGEVCLRDGPAAIAFLQKHVTEVDVVLLDMSFDVAEDRLLPLGGDASPRRTRRFQGVAILRELRKRHPDLPVVLLTAVEDLSLVDVDGELAAQSMTYILDGDDLDTLRIRINAALQESAQGLEDEELLWGASRSMQAVRRRLSVLARGGMPVLLEGETGTGKSYLAERFVHKNSGRKGAFVTLDLSTLPGDLVAAHLFGAVRGAYTGSVTDRKGVFELAHQGSLFIDEIQNAPLEVQKQLLVVLQDRKVRPIGAPRELDVDVKIIVGSNQKLMDAVSAGKFRQDLYMRLGPATRVLIPPLRDRAGDLKFFARKFVERAAEHPDNASLRSEVAKAAGLPKDAHVTLALGRPETGDAAREMLQLVLPEPAWQQLSRHTWPGNMRELAFVMHNLVTFTLVAAVDALRSGSPVKSPRLQVDPGLVGEMLAGSAGLNQAHSNGTGGNGAASINELSVKVVPQVSLNSVANEVERQYFIALFKRTSGDFERMADLLLGDPGKERAVRLRLNQLGLKVRELKGS